MSSVKTKGHINYLWKKMYGCHVQARLIHDSMLQSMSPRTSCDFNLKDNNTLEYTVTLRLSLIKSYNVVFLNNMINL